MTGRIRFIATMVTFHLKVGLVITISGFCKVRVLLQVVAPREIMIATAANFARTAIHERSARFILFPRRLWNGLIHHMYSRLCSRKGFLA